MTMWAWSLNTSEVMPPGTVNQAKWQWLEKSQAPSEKNLLFGLIFGFQTALSFPRVPLRPVITKASCAVGALDTETRSDQSVENMPL